jgi:rhombotail lipoprotein
VLKADRYDVTTLMDLAVVDSASRSIVLPAGGTDTSYDAPTFVNDEETSRAARTARNFDAALTRFEAGVRAGEANVRVSHRTGRPEGSGAGAFSPLALLFVGAVLAVPQTKRRASPSARRSGS